MMKNVSQGQTHNRNIELCDASDRKKQHHFFRQNEALENYLKEMIQNYLCFDQNKVHIMVHL